jgi:hypothetical protein
MTFHPNDINGLCRISGAAFLGSIGPGKGVLQGLIVNGFLDE